MMDCWVPPSDSCWRSADYWDSIQDITSGGGASMVSGGIDPRKTTTIFIHSESGNIGAYLDSLPRQAGVRFTYEATVKVPKETLALMSASNPTQKNEQGIYEFNMPQPIPSYLLALGVGDLAFIPIGDRAGVYAEPEMVRNAAYEFAQTDEMILDAEEMYGPYYWGRYDMLVLPPSFPFGGMENPRLTF